MMKYSVIYSFIVAALVIAGCRKSDNPKVPDLVEVPLPNITLTDGELKIPGDAPGTFNATFDVDVYFKHGLQPASMDVVVVRNGDKSNPKTLQANLTTFPTTISVTGQDLIDLFGEAIGLGDAFEVGADMIMADGTRYPAFPAGGVTYAPGIATLPGISTSLRFAAPCLYDAALYTEGDYEVVLDEWADYEAGTAIPVTKINDTTFSFKYAADNAQPIIFEVHPQDNSITVASIMDGDYGGLHVVATGVEGSEADPCTSSFTLKLNHVADPPYGDLGVSTIVLKKL